jgi:hypothetical protein
MKMLAAWDSLKEENRMLKILILILSMTVIIPTVAVVVLAEKAPLVIERGCVSQTGRLGKSAPTDDELKTFIELSLRSRFDSKVHDLQVLTPEQLKYRAIEQKDLESQKMKQTLIVNSIEIQNGSIVADCDRLIAVGNVRSTFRFPLKIEFDQISRSLGNPYGLLLKRAEPINQEVKK